ncbi:glycosyltransferase 87 family protein [Altererythrobacter sp. GH1-8]|uniref:glycosyltransferase 87 family protein n=1 Tax=Altererythrobacter sp. GH1-8 TaxID=3349333 RepID=UPI00374C8F7C
MLTQEGSPKSLEGAGGLRQRVTSLALLVVIAAVSLLAFAITVVTGGTGDYSMYLDQWHAQAATGNPWPTEHMGEAIAPNAYGPIHAVFGLLFQINWLVPKLIISGSIVFLFAVLAWDSHRNGVLTWNKLFFGLAILVLSPLVIFTNYVQGMNDAIPALCIGLACLCRRERWFLLAGLLLGLGALIKFYPLLFAPFLALEKDRAMRFGLLLVAAATFAAGMALAMIVWGDAVLSPFTFGVERGAKGLSLAWLLEVSVCSSATSGICAITTGKSVFVLLGFASLLALYAWASEMEWELALAIALPLVFFAYKVGHNQFLEAWLAVLLFVYFQPRTVMRSAIVRAAVPLMIFLSLLKTGYVLTGGLDGGGWNGGWGFVGEYMALPWALLLAYFIWSLRGHLFRNRVAMPRLAL